MKTPKKSTTERLTEFAVHSVMVLLLIVILAWAFAVTKFAFTWAFDL